MAGKPSGRPTKGDQILLRCTDEDKQTIESAIRKIEKTLPLGAKITVSSFVLQSALERARKVLEDKK